MSSFADVTRHEAAEVIIDKFPHSFNLHVMHNQFHNWSWMELPHSVQWVGNVGMSKSETLITKMLIYFRSFRFFWGISSFLFIILEINSETYSYVTRIFLSFWLLFYYYNCVQVKLSRACLPHFPTTTLGVTSFILHSELILDYAEFPHSWGIPESFLLVQENISTQFPTEQSAVRFSSIR